MPNRRGSNDYERRGRDYLTEPLTGTKQLILYISIIRPKLYFLSFKPLKMR